MSVIQASVVSRLTSLLPAPVQPDRDYGQEKARTTVAELLQTQNASVRVPPYGQRRGWIPKSSADFADGGAYPECPIAQYPLDMGRKQGRTSQTLALQVDGDGNIRYDAIARQGQRDGKYIQSSAKDLVPLLQRSDAKNITMERPSEKDVAETMAKTKAAFESIIGGKIKAAQPKSVEAGPDGPTFVRYTPASDPSAQKIIKMTTVAEDPLEPPRFKHKKVPKGPPSPPPPVLHSPPRKVTHQEQQDWMIPPCISNFKNNKGYTIPLDKRLAADGRGLQDIYINDNFAKFSEAMHLADRHAREEVRQRNLMQQRLAQKEKESQEEHLRLMAQRAREERAGIRNTVEASGNVGLVGAYGSDSDATSDSEAEADAAEDDVAARKERDEVRRRQREDRERELRMSHMGQEQRAKQLMRAQNRDISEKVALGLAKPTAASSMVDARLYNREAYAHGFGDDDSYTLYDKPLFAAQEAAAAIYRPKALDDGDTDLVGGGTEEGVRNALTNDRFNLGVSKAFEGADPDAVRDGPVQFKKDEDVFNIDNFLEDAAKSAQTAKRTPGLDTSTAASRKRSRQDQDRAQAGEDL